MATFSTQTLLLPPTTPEYAPRQIPADSWQLATIEWGENQLTGFVNKAAATAGTPVGLTIDDSRIAPNGFKRPKREGRIDTGIATLQTARVKFQEKGRSLSRLIAEKRANGVGVRGKVLRLYEWEAGTTVDLDRDIVGTYRLDDRFWLDGYRTLTGLDIRRQLKNKIFEPKKFKLTESIGIDDTAISVYMEGIDSNADIPWFTHDERYSSHSNERVIYFKAPSGEIIKGWTEGLVIQTSPNVFRFSGCTRGALNTKHLIESVTVDEGTETDNLPELAEWIYFEEKLPDFIRGITTGSTFDGRVLPDHWQIGMNLQWLDTDSLLYAAPELSVLPLRAENYGSVTVKDLIETEILPFLPATMQVSPTGKIQLRRITTIKDVGADRHIFDDSVLDKTSINSGFKSNVSHIRSAVGIRAGWDARSEEFTAPIVFGDGFQAAANDSTRDAEPLILDSKLLHSSIHTTEQIRRLLPAMAEHYLGESFVFEARAKPSAAIVDVGQRARVRLSDIPDDAQLGTLADDIDRSVLITSVSPSENGTLYQFTGTNGLSDEYYDQLTEPVLDLSVYTENATNLADDLPANSIVESGGIYYLQPGTYELSFRKKYVFLDGPFYQDAAAFIECEPGEEGPMFQLWVPHSWHSDSPRTVVTTGKGGGVGGAPGELGTVGYAVPTTGTGSIVGNGRYGTADQSGDYQVVGWSLSAQPGVQAEDYSTGDLPTISLSYNDGVLQGLPTDLGGYAGAGGGTVTINSRMRSGSTVTKTEQGGTGAVRSAGVLIVARGATMGPSARFVTSGEDGSTPQLISKPGDAQDLSQLQFYTQAGSGAGPGVVVLAMDGPFIPFALEEHVEAFPGETFYQGSQMPSPRISRATTTQHSHYRALSHTVNLSPICSRIVPIPAPATVQERPAVGVDLAFQNQRDNLIKLIEYSTVLPSDGNPGDLAVSTGELNGSSEQPVAFIRNNANEWELFNWTTSAVRTAYVQLLANYRNNGGTEYYNQETRPENFVPGSLWRQPSSKITWRLERFGPPDQFLYFDDTQVSDNRFKDPDFTDLLIGGDDWVIRDDIYTLPEFSITAPTVALTATIVGIEVSGGATLSTGTNYTLPAIPNVSAVVDSDTQVTVTVTPPSDLSNVENIEIFRDGVLITTIDELGPYDYVDSGLTAATTYSYTARAINSTDQGPFSAAFQVTTDGTQQSSNTLNPVTNLTGTVYSSTALELFWSPPNPAGNGTGYEVYLDGVLQGTLPGIATNSYFDDLLTPDTAYTYAVRAVGNGERSDDVTVNLTTNA